jgi:ABC-type nitrate/sulfonate/bicarbonate transport system substrate-binding protein
VGFLLGNYATGRKKRLTLIVIIVAAMLIFSSFLYLNLNGETVGEKGSIDVAYANFESVALFWIAQDQGFFVQSNLNVTSHKYDTGVGSLNAMLNGEADIAVGPAEFPLVGKAMLNEKIKAIGCIDKIDFIYLVGRRDHGVNSVSDLAGKRVGTTMGTSSEYYLGRLLSLNSMSMQDITLVDVRTPADWVNAVVNGSIDAVVTAQPYANSAKDALGDNAFVWNAQSNQPQYALMISTDEWINEHPNLIRSFLKCMLQAEEFANNSPAQAKSIVKEHMNFTEAYIETVWKQNQYGLFLDLSLVASMDAEARWLINNNLTNKSVVPDFNNFIYVDGLKTVKPESVNVMG